MKYTAEEYAAVLATMDSVVEREREHPDNLVIASALRIASGLSEEMIVREIEAPEPECCGKPNEIFSYSMNPDGSMGEPYSAGGAVDFVRKCLAIFGQSEPDRIVSEVARKVLQSFSAIPVNQTEELISSGCRCQNCGFLYRVDVQVCDSVWAKISKPSENLLCGSCIMKRIEGLGSFDALRIVPTDPTEEMITRGLATTNSFLDIKGSQLTVNREKMRRRYKAMIGAA